MNDNPSDKTVEMLRCAFGSYLQNEDYLPLLYVLYQDMAYRSLAEAVTDFLDGKYDVLAIRHKIEPALPLSRHTAYSLVLGDTFYVDSTYIPDLEKTEKIKAKLDECGYAEWLAEP